MFPMTSNQSYMFTPKMSGVRVSHRPPAPSLIKLDAYPAKTQEYRRFITVLAHIYMESARQTALNAQF